MKRSVAIRGPTPMFVRWAIQRQCPLREIHAERLPETTFRQLRAIRELSLGKLQGRIQEGFCLHPNNQVEASDAALGFSVDEVADLFGGTQSIEKNCRGCPANAGAELVGEFWAGCFGIVSADLRWNLDKIIRGEIVSNAPISDLHSPGLGGERRREFLTEAAEVSAFDLPRFVNKVSEQPFKSESCTNSSAELPIWARLWHQRVPNSDQLLLIEQTIERVLEYLNPGADGVHASACCAPLNSSTSKTESTAQPDTVLEAYMTQDLRQFLHAVRRCRKHDLPLHVELVPAGYSDGQTWRIFPHCQNCKQAWPQQSQPCAICGLDGKYQNEIKLRVLGLRPYIRLADMIGKDETRRILRMQIPSNL